MFERHKQTALAPQMASSEIRVSTFWQVLANAIKVFPNERP